MAKKRRGPSVGAEKKRKAVKALKSAASKQKRAGGLHGRANAEAITAAVITKDAKALKRATTKKSQHQKAAKTLSAAAKKMSKRTTKKTSGRNRPKR